MKLLLFATQEKTQFFLNVVFFKKETFNLNLNPALKMITSAITDTNIINLDVEDTRSAIAKFWEANPALYQIRHQIIIKHYDV